MVLNLTKHDRMLRSNNINITYSGPMWENGLKSIANLVENRLAMEGVSTYVAKSVFSVFVEQVTNVLMYSAKKEKYHHLPEGPVVASSGTLVIGSTESVYFVQTGNIIKNENVDLVKYRLDFLNSLERSELRRFHKEQLNSQNDNPESKGAGLGFIEIARRASAPIYFSFEPNDNDTSYFSMYVEIAKKDRRIDNVV